MPRGSIVPGPFSAGAAMVRLRQRSDLFRQFGVAALGLLAIVAGGALGAPSGRRCFLQVDSERLSFVTN